ncbi:MAG: hypothetical protein ACLUSS_07755 [Faecalibacterium sp.]
MNTVGEERRKTDLEALQRYEDYLVARDRVRDLEYKIRQCDKIAKMDKPIELPKPFRISGKALIVVSIVLLLIAKVSPTVAILGFLAISAYGIYRLFNGDKLDREYEGKLYNYNSEISNYKRKNEVGKERLELEQKLKIEKAKWERAKLNGYCYIPTGMDTKNGREQIKSYLRSGRSNSIEEACIMIRHEARILQMNDQLTGLNDKLKRILPEDDD